MNKIVSFLTAFPKSKLFQDQGLHVWGVGLWAYFFLTHAKHPELVPILAVALATLHEFWYDRELPGATPGVGSPVSNGRFENWLGYVGGITLATILWLFPVVGIVGFWLTLAGIFGVGVVLAIRGK